AGLYDSGHAVAEHIGQREQLGLWGTGRREALAHDVEVIHVPRDREPERAGLERLAHQAPHGLELVGGRLAVGALLTHRVEPDGRVTDERADVDAEPLADRLHVFGEALPVPRHARLA